MLFAFKQVIEQVQDLPADEFNELIYGVLTEQLDNRDLYDKDGHYLHLDAQGLQKLRVSDYLTFAVIDPELHGTDRETRQSALAFDMAIIDVSVVHDAGSTGSGAKNEGFYLVEPGIVNSENLIGLSMARQGVPVGAEGSESTIMFDPRSGEVSPPQNHPVAKILLEHLRILDS